MCAVFWALLNTLVHWADIDCQGVKQLKKIPNTLVYWDVLDCKAVKR